MRELVQLQARLGIATTFGVIVCLGMGAMIFLKLSNDLVIGPIEKMIEKVHEITNDPLKAAHDEEQRVLVDELQDEDN